MKPNILFICTDQQRRASMGFWRVNEYRNSLLGAPDPVYTPNIDRLAREGIVVSEAYSSYPVCSPFRAMLFSGRYPADNGVWQNCCPNRPDELHKDIPTFTDVLSDNGYSVGYVGKWHLENPRADFDREGNYIAENSEYSGARYYADGSPEGAPTCWDTLIPRDRQRKIDYLYAYNTYDVFRYSEKDDKLKIPRLFDKEYTRHSPAPGEWSPEFETDIAIRFISNESGVRDSEKPFALFVNYNPPHSPYESREDTHYESYDRYYKDAKAEDRLPRRENVTLASTQFEERARVYFSHVCGIDGCVGRLLSALDSIGQRDNTIVVYTSDHGEMLGSHGLMSKNVPYEEATAIPFIMRYPDKLTHRIEPLFLGAVDMMPTILSLTDTKIPTGVAGEDYSALLVSGEGARPSSVPFIQMKRKGVRTAKYLFAVSYGDENAYGETVLYDIENDPYQKNNLRVTDIPESDFKHLREALGTWLKRSNDPWYKKRLYDGFIVYP